MSMPSWIESYLIEHHLPHVVRHHNPVFTSQQLAEVEHISGKNVAKVVVSMADEQPVMLVLPASKAVSLRKVKDKLKSKHLRLAREDEIAMYFPETEVGAIPPLDHWQNVPIYVDDSSFEKDQMMFQAGNHQDAVILNYQDWFKTVHPQVANFAIQQPSTKNEARVNTVLWGLILLSATFLGVLAFGLYYFLSFLGWAYTPFGFGVATLAFFVSTIILAGFSPMVLACLVAALTFFVPLLYLTLGRH